jgi:hypothetical protein
MSSPKRRIETDVMKLMMSDYEVTLVNDNMQEFFVIFKGPTESKIASLYPSIPRRVKRTLRTESVLYGAKLRPAEHMRISAYRTGVIRPKSTGSVVSGGSDEILYSRMLDRSQQQYCSYFKLCD